MLEKGKREAEIFRDLPRGVPNRDMEKRKGLELLQVPNAKWMDVDTIRQEFPYETDRILIGAVGSQLVGVKDNRHIMTVAGSRAGKSVTVANNLFHYRGSSLVIDPKGELANLTAKWRKEALGQEVYILDPFERCDKALVDLKASFNPLFILHPNNKRLLEDAGLIADALVPQSPKTDPHWDESAKIFIEGLILYVATNCWDFPGKQTLVKVYELLNKKRDQEENGEEGEDDDKENRGKSIDLLIREMFAYADSLRKTITDENSPLLDIADDIEAAALDFDERPLNEKSSVLSTVRRHLKFLGYRAIQSVLQDHDFDLTDLKTEEKGATIYLVLPAGRLGTCNRWLRLFINLALEAMEREKTIPDPPVLICMDEFPVLGHMKQIEDAAGQIAGFGVKLWPILQDLGQIKELYRGRWETFMGNAGVVQFFGNNDLTTLEYIQKRCGKTSIKMQKDQERPGGADKSDIVIAPHIEQHDLITAEEVARYFSREDPLKRQLVIVGGKVMIAQRLEHFNENSPGYGQFKGLLDGH